MTADFNQSSSDLPELPESIKHLGEGPSGDAFRELYAEMVKEFTPQEISQVIGDPDRAKEARALANWKTILEDSGWTVVTGSTSQSDSFPLDRSTMTALIPTLEHYLRADDRLDSADEDPIIFVERPTGLSNFEKEQAAARPARYSGLPDDFIIFRSDAKTIDQRLKDLLGRKLNLGRQGEAKSSEDVVGSDQLAAFEHLRTDEEAAASLSKNSETELYTPTAAEFRAEYAALLSRLEFLESSRGGTTGQSTQKWLAEYDRMVAAQATADTRTEPLPANPDELKLSDTVRKLLKKTEGLSLVDPLKHSKSEAELRSEGNRVHDLVEKSYREKGFSATVVDILFGKLGSEDSPKAEAEPEKPETPEAPEPTSSFGSKFGGPISGVFVDYLELIGSKEGSKLEEPRTIKDLSENFSVQDLIADYDESRLPEAARYITLEGNLPKIRAQVVELFTAEGFSDRDRLVGLLGLLDGYEASEDYSTGDAYHISRIRQLLKRQR